MAVEHGFRNWPELEAFTKSAATGPRAAGDIEGECMALDALAEQSPQAHRDLVEMLTRLERHYRDTRILGIGAGTSEIYLEIAAVVDTDDRSDRLADPGDHRGKLEVAVRDVHRDDAADGGYSRGSQTWELGVRVMRAPPLMAAPPCIPQLTSPALETGVLARLR